jgi:hypothetical protein
MGDRTDASKILVGNPEGKISLGGLGMYGRMVLKFIQKMRAWIGFMWLEIKSRGGLL